MKLKSAVLLAFALCCGLVAMLGVQQMVSKNKQAVVTKKKILVAVTNVEAGSALDDTKVKFIDWPASSVPQGAITKSEEYTERALLTQAFEGTPILLTMLGEKGQFGASMAIPVGYRLISIPVNETKTNSGQLRPGDRVDILVTYKNKNVQTTKTLLEYIQVFSVDSHRQVENTKSDAKTKNVAILLTPEQTQVVRLADALGDLDLATRNKNDTEIVNTPEMIDSLLREMNGSGHNQSQPNKSEYSVVNEPSVLQEATPEVKQPMVETPALLQPVQEPKVVENKSMFKQNSSSFLNQLSNDVAGLFKTKGEKKPNPTWNVKIFTGEELADVEFEQVGKKKDDWIQKVQVTPEAKSPVSKLAAPGYRQTQAPKIPSLENLTAPGSKPVTQQNSAEVLNFLNELGWSKSQAENMPQEFNQ